MESTKDFKQNHLTQHLSDKKDGVKDVDELIFKAQYPKGFNKLPNPEWWCKMSGIHWYGKRKVSSDTQ